MAIYIIGAKLSGEATRSDEGFAQQLEAAARIRQQHGGRLIAAYAMFGRYDMLFITDYPDQKEALAAVEANMALGEITFEVAEAVALEDFLKATN
jgi:uncharacterized protein with GYD domain